MNWATKPNFAETKVTALQDNYSKDPSKKLCINFLHSLPHVNFRRTL